MHELFFPSPDYRTDFLYFQFKNKDDSKNSVSQHGGKSGLERGKKHPSDLQIRLLPHFYLLDPFLSNFFHHISIFTH